MSKMSELDSDRQQIERFHPDRSLPDCMMPDGGNCCAGHAAVCNEWNIQRVQIDELAAACVALNAALDQFWNSGDETSDGQIKRICAAQQRCKEALALSRPHQSTPEAK